MAMVVHVCTKYHGYYLRKNSQKAHVQLVQLSLSNRSLDVYALTSLTRTIHGVQLVHLERRQVVGCYHGDGSDGRHVCTKYHGHTHYYQATMAMVVMGGMCVRPYTLLSGYYVGNSD